MFPSLFSPTARRDTVLRIVCTPGLAMSLTAADWRPAHDDPPVPPAEAEKIEQALPSAPIVAPKAPRKVLVYSATAGFRHASIPHGKLALTRMGQSTGAYEATVSDDPAHFEPGVLGKFDGVILLSPTLDFFVPNEKDLAGMPHEEQQSLRERHRRLIDSLIDYVKSGGGLVGIHAATDACLGQPRYGEMLGGFFDGHPWGSGSKVTIVVEDRGHALNEPVFDVDSFPLVEEIYQFKEPYSREKLRVLLHLDPARSDPVKGMKREDGDYPVAWVHRFGEGRVFYSSLGHNEHIYWNAMLLKHYLAGIQFATGDLHADTAPSAR